MTFFYPLSYTQKLEEKIMKNFILKIIGLVVVLLTLTACGGGNVNMVKTGTFNDYQGTTVGDAFDNWDICSSTSWDEFETDNGRNIVALVAKNPSTPVDLLDELSMHKSWVVRATVAARDRTPVQALQRLMLDSNEIVRTTAESNINRRKEL